MEGLTENLRRIVHSNRRLFKNFHALLVFYKYKNESEFIAFEELDREIEKVYQHILTSLSEIKVPLFSEPYFSKENKAWIRIAKLQRKVIEDFSYELFDIKNGRKDVGNSTFSKLEHLDNMADELMEKVRKKIEFYQNVI